MNIRRYRITMPGDNSPVLGLDNLPSDHATLMMLAPSVALDTLDVGAHALGRNRGETYWIVRVDDAPEVPHTLRRVIDARNAVIEAAKALADAGSDDDVRDSYVAECRYAVDDLRDAEDADIAEIIDSEVTP